LAGLTIGSVAPLTNRIRIVIAVECLVDVVVAGVVILGVGGICVHETYTVEFRRPDYLNGVCCDDDVSCSPMSIAQELDGLQAVKKRSPRGSLPQPPKANEGGIRPWVKELRRVAWGVH
jgi:hypothetical protein